MEDLPRSQPEPSRRLIANHQVGHDPMKRWLTQDPHGNGRPCRAAEVVQDRARDGAPAERSHVGRLGAGDRCLAAGLLREPAHLGSGEIRIEWKAAHLGQTVGMLGERADHAGRAAILPADRRTVGMAGRRVPRQHRLALVAEADRSDVLAGIGQRSAPSLQDRIQQFTRVLDDRAARPWLWMHPRRGLPRHRAAGGDHQRLGGGSPGRSRGRSSGERGVDLQRASSRNRRCMTSNSLNTVHSWTIRPSTMRCWVMPPTGTPAVRSARRRCRGHDGSLRSTSELS